MAHYDGPAFYRRTPAQEPKKRTTPTAPTVRPRTAHRPVPRQHPAAAAPSPAPDDLTADYIPISNLHPFIYSDHKADPTMVAAFDKTPGQVFLFADPNDDVEEPIEPAPPEKTAADGPAAAGEEKPMPEREASAESDMPDETPAPAETPQPQPAESPGSAADETRSAHREADDAAESIRSSDPQKIEDSRESDTEETAADDDSVLGAFHMPDDLLKKALGPQQPAAAEPAPVQPAAPATPKPAAAAMAPTGPAPTAATAHLPADSGKTTDYTGYRLPSTDLLRPVQDVDSTKDDEWVANQTGQLNATLKAFHVDGSVVHQTVGPTVTQFEIQLAPGVKVSKITALIDDLKLALAAQEIRIEAPIPGKRTVGIEIPNAKPRSVALKEIVDSTAFAQSLSPLTVALGIDLFGRPVVADLRKMPHGLIAGSTGSGKSVFINGILLSLLLKATPDQLQLLLIDPKAVELAPYNNLPHLLAPVISDPEEAVAALDWVVERMEQRYTQLVAAGVRNIEEFNQRAKAQREPEMQMPYIVVVIDELADLMMTTANAVQDSIARLTQKARAAGIHLLIATQRPSVDVLTGVIKNNIPTRIAFMVSSQVDSRTILDAQGADRLLGKGDMLYRANGSNHPLRLQGAYVTGDEIDRVTAAITAQAQADYVFTNQDLQKAATVTEEEDPLWDQVLDYVQHEDTISTSKLQRLFSVGYNRAANIIDHLEAKNLVSGPRGSKPRKVFYRGDADTAATAHQQDEEKE